MRPVLARLRLDILDRRHSLFRHHGILDLDACRLLEVHPARQTCLGSGSPLR